MSENLRILGKYSAAMEAGDTDAVFEFWADDFVSHVTERVSPERVGSDIRGDEQHWWQQARAALPEHVPLTDAVHNISRAVLVAEAFRSGNLDLLGKAMTDALHQPYRLPLIPGAREALDAAKEAGAPAAAVSGAGPSIIAFSARHDPTIADAMRRAFRQAGHSAQTFHLKMSNAGAQTVME